jgi:flagellar biosynthesis protein FlhB
MSDSSPQPPLSQHRLREARRLGVSPRSPELTAGVVLLTAAWVGQACLPQLLLALQALVASGFDGSLHKPLQASSELSPACLRVAQETLRLWAVCWAAALLTDLAQVGFVWSPVTLLPHKERVSPASGFTRLLGWQTLERSSLLSIKLACGVFAVAGLSEFALRAVSSSTESSTLFRQGTTWTSLTLACAGGICLLSGLLDAWLRQTRWRLSLEQSEDERRHRE